MATKQIKTVGTILKQAREQQKMSLCDVATELGIRVQYLSCIEQDEFSILPGSIYVTRYVKAYAELLGLNATPLINKIRSLLTDQETTIPQYRLKRTNFWVGPRILKYLGLGGLALACFGYIVWLGVETVAPPALDITSPSNNVTSNNRSVVVQGKTNIDAQLTINDQSIMKHEDGSFSQEIQLSQGVNTLKITAVKKHSKEQTIYRVIRYDGQSGVSFLHNVTIQ